MSDVFISYSRRDQVFVRRLYDALLAHQRETWVDWKDIPPTAQWWAEICAGIDAANTFIFVISPDSVRSRPCYDEIEQASRHSKRIIPLLWRELPGDPAQAGLHPAINAHQWIFFRETDDFEASLATLLQALDLDLDYVRQHTQLLLRARNWDSIGRDTSPLLRGRDLNTAEAWLARAVGKQPPPAALHTDYILASRRAANRFQRAVLSGVIAALVVAVGLALLSFGLFRRSESALGLAETRGTDVARQAATAQANLVQSWDAQALFLANQSQQQRAAGDRRTALLLALEGLAHFEQGVNHVENVQALQTALAMPGRERFYADGIQAAAWSPDASQLFVVSADGSARLWDLATGAARFTLPASDLREAIWSPDGARLLVGTGGGQVHLLEPSTGAALITLDEPARLSSAQWSQDGARLLVVDDTALRIWDLHSGALLLDQPLDFYESALSNHVEGARWFRGDRQVIAWTLGGGLGVWDAATGEAVFSYRHDSTIYGTAWPPDESGLLMWAADGMNILWDTATWQKVTSLDAPVGGLTGARWNLDGSRLLTWAEYVGRDYSTYFKTSLWDLAAHQALVTVDGQEARLSRDGTQILTWADRQVWLWDAASGENTQMLTFDAKVERVEWSADEQRLLVQAGREVSLWDAASGRRLLLLPHAGPVLDLAWSGDERAILTRAGDMLRLWETGSSGTPLVLPHEDRVNGVVWSPDGTRILTWSNDGTTRLWDAATGEERCLTRHQTSDVASGAAWNHQGTAFLTWGVYAGTARVWDPATCEARLILQHGPGSTIVAGGAWSQDDTRILTWSFDQTARLWDAATGESLAVLQHDDLVTDAAWNADETRLLTVSNNGQIHLWDGASGQRLLTLPHERGVNQAAWNHAGTQILTQTGDGLLHLWDAATGRERYRLEMAFPGAEWSRDDRRLLTWVEGEEGMEARIVDAQSGKVLRVLQPQSFILAARWNSDEMRVLGLGGTSAWVWDASSGEILFTAAHEAEIQGAAWNPEETKLLTWAYDGTARVWDASTGQRLFTLEHAGWVIDAGWSADGRQVVTCGDDDVAKIWTVDPAALLAAARTEAIRPLTEDERAQYFLPPAAPQN